MKRKLFENIGGNSFKLIREFEAPWVSHPEKYGSEPVGGDEEYDSDAAKDVLTNFFNEKKPNSIPNSEFSEFISNNAIFDKLSENELNNLVDNVSEMNGYMYDANTDSFVIYNP